MADPSRKRSVVIVHSPVVDETIIQLSDVHASISGRPMFSTEIAVAQSVFMQSVDYSRVRIFFGLFAGTTAGNTIRLPNEFDITKRMDKELLIHEMTHVWQFQHFGPGYITTSLLQQAHAELFSGTRDWAYEYTLGTTERYSDYNPEQQAFIVENYYAMSLDRSILGMDLGVTSGAGQYFKSTHLRPDGRKIYINATARRAEINAEWDNHVRVIRQMQGMPPLSTTELLTLRRQTVLIDSSALDPRLPPVTRDRDMMQIPSLIRIEFPGL